jgi:capsular polysaccharide biosynthesis protein
MDSTTQQRLNIEGYMEIMIFLRLLIRRWWITLLIVSLAVIGTYFFTESQTPIYSSSVTYVVSPSSQMLNEVGFLSGLSVLGGQPTVANTYASIASSATVKRTARDTLGLNAAQAKNLIVTSRVLNGTNIIEISVEGADPGLVQLFTIKIGESAIDYVNKLNGVYKLELLDEATPADVPIKPNKRLNLILGAALGLVLGIGITFLTGLNEY